MASTPGHTLFAAVAAIPTNEATLPVKLSVLMLLVISHGPLDAIPHLHYYSFADLKKHFAKNALGAAIELGGGLIALPIAISLITGVNLWWLGACVFAASLFDFLVVANIKTVILFNKQLHWWDKNESASLRTKIIGECVLMLFFTSLLLIMILK